MKAENKRKIKKVIAGAALAAVLASGFYYMVSDVNENSKHYRMPISYNGENFLLMDLFLLSDGENNRLCTLKFLDSESTISFGPGISLGNNLMLGADGIAFGMSFGTKTTFGYESIDTKEIIAISGKESETGYTPKRVGDIINRAYAKENNYEISAESLIELLALNKGKTK